MAEPLVDIGTQSTTGKSLAEPTPQAYSQNKDILEEPMGLERCFLQRSHVHVPGPMGQLTVAGDPMPFSDLPSTRHTRGTQGYIQAKYS